MANYKITGTEKSDYNLYTGQLLQISSALTEYTVIVDGVFTARVQIGNAAAGLVGGERVWLDVEVYSALTGDWTLLPQLFVDVPVGKTIISITSEPYLVRENDKVRIKAYSNDSSDNSVGGCVEALLIGH